MYKLDKCALCGMTKEIKLSHIVPSFVGKYLKKTSISGIRNIEKVNKQAQDIEKHYLLCGDCEELFSAKERWFANKLFYPYMEENKDEFEYDENLYYFLTSLSWRSLYLDIMDYIENQRGNIDILQCLIDSEVSMRNFLLNKSYDIGKFEHHILFFDRIETINGSYSKEISMLSPHVTIHRGIASYTVWNEKKGTYFTFTNMMGIIVVTFYKKSSEEKWENTNIVHGKGIISAKNQKVNSIVMNELKELMEEHEKAKERISEKQVEKIKTKLENCENVEEYKIYKDIIYDKNIKD